MPATQEPPAPVTDNEPRGPSPAFNTMEEKLTKFLKPFQDSANPGGTVDTLPEKTIDTAPKLPPTEPAKPEEAKSTDEELPESIKKSPKASEEFKKVRDSAKQFRVDSEKYAAQVKALEGEIAKLKSAPEKPSIPPPEFEALKKEHEELSDQLKIASIERHPNFKNHFDSRTTAATEKARAVLGDDLTSKASKLAQLPPTEYRAEQLDKMITELQEASPSKAVFLTDLIRDMNGIAFDKETALKKAREDYDLVQRHEHEKSEAAKAEQAKATEQFIASIWATTEEFEAFKTGDDPKVNEAVEARKKLMKSWMAGETIDELAPRRIPGLAMEALYLKKELLPSLREENSKLLKQIQEMTQSTPRPGDTNGKPSASQTTPGNSFMQRYLANKP